MLLLYLDTCCRWTPISAYLTFGAYIQPGDISWEGIHLLEKGDMGVAYGLHPLLPSEFTTPEMLTIPMWPFDMCLGCISKVWWKTLESSGLIVVGGHGIRMCSRQYLNGCTPCQLYHNLYCHKWILMLAPTGGDLVGKLYFQRVPTRIDLSIWVQNSLKHDCFWTKYYLNVKGSFYGKLSDASLHKRELIS